MQLGAFGGPFGGLFGNMLGGMGAGGGMVPGQVYSYSSSTVMSSGPNGTYHSSTTSRQGPGGVSAPYQDSALYATLGRAQQSCRCCLSF